MMDSRANIGARVSKKEYERFKRHLVSYGLQHRVEVMSIRDEDVLLTDAQGRERQIASMTAGFCFVYPVMFAL